LMRELGFPGVVTGMLTEDGQIDLPRMHDIMQLAGDMSVTFHRAFDMGADPMLMLQQLTDLGVDRILTSGQRDTAEQGLPLLEKLLTATRGPVILPGSGIRLNNMALFLQAGATELHSSASHTVPSGMRYRQPGVSMNRDGGMDEFARVEVDAAVVSQMKALMRDTVRDPLV
ncbi:MAG: copper homeostasis protein CutC, partial [Plesiomonas sp.]